MLNSEDTEILNSRDVIEVWLKEQWFCQVQRVCKVARASPLSSVKNDKFPEDNSFKKHALPYTWTFKMVHVEMCAMTRAECVTHVRNLQTFCTDGQVE